MPYMPEGGRQGQLLLLPGLFQEELGSSKILLLLPEPDLTR